MNFESGVYSSNIVCAISVSDFIVHVHSKLSHYSLWLFHTRMCLRGWGKYLNGAGGVVQDLSLFVQDNRSY